MEDRMLLYNINAPKKPTNLTVNSDLLHQAKDLNINLSSILELALSDAVKQRKREEWKKENTESIDSYNQFVSENSLFSDGSRTF